MDRITLIPKVVGERGRRASDVTPILRNGQNRRYCQTFCICFLISCSSLFYFSFYIFVPPTQSQMVGIPGWNYNTSRETSRYVLPDNITSVHAPETLCSSQDLLLVIVVCSAVEDFEQRDAIRSSWASSYLVSKNASTARVVFLLGLAENDTLQSKIDDEASGNGDIIQERFFDTYNNLTLKSVMMLKWMNSHCTGARYLMKTDDDMYVNVPLLIQLLQFGRLPPRNLLFGCLICGARPVYNTNSKWYSPKYMFSDQVYPNYLSGTGYVMSFDVVRKLYKVALQTPLFHLEDIFITGLCSKKAHIGVRNHPAFTYEKRKFDPCIYKGAVTTHQVTPEQMHKMFSLLSDPRVISKCKTATFKKTSFTCRH